MHPASSRLLRQMLPLLLGLAPVIAFATPTSASSPAVRAGAVPQARFFSAERYRAHEKPWIRYAFKLSNAKDFPDAIFAPAPDLPPCGLNKNASRTWVDLFDADSNQRLYGFCALTHLGNGPDLYFALPPEQAPPRAVRIEFNDRRLGKTVVSAPVPVNPLRPPVAEFVGVRKVEHDGKAFNRYQFRLLNGADYGPDVFAPGQWHPCKPEAAAPRTFVAVSGDIGGTIVAAFCDPTSTDFREPWVDVPVGGTTPYRSMAVTLVTEDLQRFDSEYLAVPEPPTSP